MIVTGTGRHIPPLSSAAPAASIAWLIAGYRRWISPLLPPACRFHPSCSTYASEAIAVHGLSRGIVLAARRLGRCHPWCEGGMDPVPPRRHEKVRPARGTARERI